MGCLKLAYYQTEPTLKVAYRNGMASEKGVQGLIRVDPLAHMRVSWTPYNFCRNNPISNTDPTGALDAPIYDENANFLGTDDEGLQGKAIVMNKGNFKQGMSHDDALSKSLGAEVLKGDGSLTNLTDHYNGLKTRFDYDGHLTLDEANKWYRTGNGQPLFASLSKLDLSGIHSDDFRGVGKQEQFNLLLNSNSTNDGLVYGSLTLKLYPNNQVRAYADKYDFDMKSAWNPLNWSRNAETVIGRKVAGQGTGYEINLTGSKSISPVNHIIK